MKRGVLAFLCGLSLLFTACAAPAESVPPTLQTTLISIVSTVPSSSSDSTTSTATVAESTLSSTKPSSSSSVYSTGGTTAVSSTGLPTSVTTTTATTTTATASAMSTTVTTTVSAPPPSVNKPSQMRAAWLSYLELDTIFVSSSTEKQVCNKFDQVLDDLDSFGVNTLFFHVRANSDAYYRSDYYQPATSVKPFLEKGFDPLTYMVEQAKKHGITVHAWINPYRVGKNTSFLVDDIPSFSDANNRYYYVPSSTVTQRLVLNGVRELVERYQIAGVQYDDYFYPENCLEATTVYAYESEDYEAYQQGGGALTIADWRRASVDALVASTYSLVKSRGMIFGISPAINADATYEKLYANPKKWMAESGYVDYICPQIYTGFEHEGDPFDKAVDRWLSYPRHSSVGLSIGIAVYKAGYLNDTYAKSGAKEWATHDAVLKRSVSYVHSKGLECCFYSCSYFNPDSVPGISKTNNVQIALREIENLLTVL